MQNNDLNLMDALSFFAEFLEDTDIGGASGRASEWMDERAERANE